MWGEDLRFKGELKRKTSVLHLRDSGPLGNIIPNGFRKWKCYVVQQSFRSLLSNKKYSLDECPADFYAWLARNIFTTIAVVSDHQQATFAKAQYASLIIPMTRDLFASQNRCNFFKLSVCTLTKINNVTALASVTFNDISGSAPLKSGELDWNLCRESHNFMGNSWS